MVFVMLQESLITIASRHCILSHVTVSVVWLEWHFSSHSNPVSLLWFRC